MKKVKILLFIKRNRNMFTTNYFHRIRMLRKYIVKHPHWKGTSHQGFTSVMLILMATLMLWLPLDTIMVRQSLTYYWTTNFHMEKILGNSHTYRLTRCTWLEIRVIPFSCIVYFVSICMTKYTCGCLLKHLLYRKWKILCPTNVWIWIMKSMCFFYKIIVSHWHFWR